MPLEAFWSSLNSHGEGVSLQSIADSLRNLHQILRTGGQGEAEGQRKGTVSGDHNFRFSLNFEPRSEVAGLCQTGVLVATVTSSEDSQVALPVTYKWQRRVGARLVNIPGIKTNMYHTSADDIGFQIICEATLRGHPSLRGTATGVIGPFAVDPITRMNVETHLSAPSGTSSFPARHVRHDNDRHPRDLQIKVSQDFVKVVHPGAERGQSEVSASYTADYPRVLIRSDTTCGFRLELSEDPDKAYMFQALSRTSRDFMSMLIRSYHARRYVATSFVLSRLFQNPATPGAPLTSVESEDFDVQGLSVRLGKELNRTVEQLDVVERVVRNATLEKCELQVQLRETIGSYTDAIEKLHAHLALAQGGSNAKLQLQLHETRSNTSKLQLELQEHRSLINELGQTAPVGGGAGSDAELEALRTEIQQLRNRISSLQGNQHDQSKRDITRQEEKRRLRADVDMLTHEKEALEANVHQADKEKADLVDNFMYVKDKLDELQMQSLSTPAASPEHQRQVAQIKAAYSQVAEERNRLSQKVDALDRERERQKHQREAALERIMTANARLLEDKDKLERERTRLSELYERTIGALGVFHKASPAAGAGGDGGGKAEADEGPCDQMALDALLSELEITNKQIEKAAQESEALRTRLRRLALV